MLLWRSDLIPMVHRGVLPAPFLAHCLPSKHCQLLYPYPSTNLFCKDHSVHQIQYLFKDSWEISAHGSDQPLLTWVGSRKDDQSVTHHHFIAAQVTGLAGL